MHHGNEIVFEALIKIDTILTLCSHRKVWTLALHFNLGAKYKNISNHLLGS